MALRWRKEQEARQWGVIIAATVHTGCECDPHVVCTEGAAYVAFFTDGTIPPPADPHTHEPQAEEPPDDTPTAPDDHEMD